MYEDRKSYEGGVVNSKVDLKEPQSDCISAPSYMLKESNPFTRIGHANEYRNLANADTNSGLTDNYTRASPGQLYTTFDLHLKHKRAQNHSN